MAANSLAGAAIVEELLNDKNYKEWSACMHDYLVRKGLWCVVENGYTEPSDSESAAAAAVTDDGEDDGIVADACDQSNNNVLFEATGRAENFDDCKRKNKLAFYAIWISCDKEAADLILDVSSAKEAWDELAEKYDPASICVKKSHLLTQFNIQVWNHKAP